jgi:hypothetical protein
MEKNDEYTQREAIEPDIGKNFFKYTYFWNPFNFDNN